MTALLALSVALAGDVTLNATVGDEVTEFVFTNLPSCVPQKREVQKDGSKVRVSVMATGTVEGAMWVQVTFDQEMGERGGKRPNISRVTVEPTVVMAAGETAVVSQTDVFHLSIQASGFEQDTKRCPDIR